jgi:hypothetical protein
MSQKTSQDTIIQASYAHAINTRPELMLEILKIIKNYKKDIKDSINNGIVDFFVNDKLAKNPDPKVQSI